MGVSSELCRRLAANWKGVSSELGTGVSSKLGMGVSSELGTGVSSKLEKFQPGSG
jgi:hypothetical protein